MNPPAAVAPTGGADHASAPVPGYAPYPCLSPEDVAPPLPPPYHAATATPSAYGGNPYIASLVGASAECVPPRSKYSLVSRRFGPNFSRSSRAFFLSWCLTFADMMDSVKDVLRKMEKRVGEVARKTETHQKLLAAL
jgi:hypothetical protein